MFVFFFAIFCQDLVDVQKPLLKNILRGYYLVQVGVIIWSKLGAFNNANLDQIITPDFLPTFFNETPILQFLQTVLKTKQTWIR